MWFLILLIIYVYAIAYLFYYESYSIYSIWSPDLQSIKSIADIDDWSLYTWKIDQTVDEDLVQYAADLKLDAIVPPEVFSSYFVVTYVFIFIFILFIFIVVDPIEFYADSGCGYLQFLWISTLVQQGSTGLLLLYRLVVRFLYLLYTYLFNKLKTLLFILLQINNFFICWRPIFRKISYYGMFHSSQAKWFLKNFNKRS